MLYKVMNKQNELPNKITLSAETLPSILMLLYVSIDLMKLFKVIPLNLGNILIVLCGSISISYSILKRNIKIQRTFLIFLCFYSANGLIGLFTNGNIDIEELLWPLAFGGMAMLILNYDISYTVAKVIYYFIAIFFMVQIILSKGAMNINMLSSRNTISVLLLIYFSIYAITSLTHNKRMTIYPVLLGLVVNIMAIGRSGILTFLLLAVLFTMFKFDGLKQGVRNPIKGIIVVSVGVLTLYIFYKVFSSYFIEMILNYQNRGLESLRSLIWEDYIKQAFGSYKNLIFGAPIKNTMLLNEYSHNLHNSFLMLHAKYGLVPFITVFLIIIKSVYYFFRKGNYLYMILLITITFRMQFDYTNFNAPLDVVLFYFMFNPYFEKYRYKKSRKVGLQYE